MGKGWRFLTAMMDKGVFIFFGRNVGRDDADWICVAEEEKSPNVFTHIFGYGKTENDAVEDAKRIRDNA